MTTNAQAALQAAATIYTAGHGHTNQGDVLQASANFKTWLDVADQQTQLSGSSDRRGQRKMCGMKPSYADLPCYYVAGHACLHSWQDHGQPVVVPTGDDE